MAVLRVRQGALRGEIAFEPPARLQDLLAAHGFVLSHPCGGRGVCGKCAVALTGEAAPMNAAERRAGSRLSCQAVLLGDCEAVLPEAPGLEQIALGAPSVPPAAEGLGPKGSYGAAVDIGTTTLALRLYSLWDGRERASAARINPQTAVAADVMGRIGAALDGAGPRLKALVTEALDGLLEEACGRAGCGPGQTERLVVTGNTTMLTLLTGRAPVSLSRAPFQADCLFGLHTRLGGIPAYLPRCISAFVGADISCALLSSGMPESAETALLCDIGTNGEMALWKDGTLFVTSTAAGPVFEGAGIVRGCPSVRGAIDRVWVQQGALAVHTIGDAPALGVCGSGLIDAVAALLRLGQIDETGATEEEELPLGGGVSLYPRDIRSVQLAKAAIAAGMETLLESAGVSPKEVDRLYIAGGFGSHLDLGSSADIGLIPRALVPRAVSLGNAALSGAVMLLLNPSLADGVRALADGARHVALGGNRRFNEAYVEHMMFPEAGEGA